MRHWIFSFTILTLSLASVGSAKAGMITFDSSPSSFTSYTEQGVTFTAVGGGLIGTTQTPNGTNGLLSSENPRQLLRADIAGGATTVSVDLGDFDSDPDNLILNVFDAANNQVGSTSLMIDASFSGMKTLSVSAPNIAYAIFGSNDPSLNGSSVYADNFTFAAGSVSATPEPASLTLLSLGALGLFGYRCRRRKVAAG